MSNDFRMTKRRFSWKWVVLAVLAVIIAASAVVYLGYRHNLEPVDAKSNAAVSFEIPSGQRAPEIAKHLKDAGLIRDANTFVTYVNLHGLRSTLQAGTYSLSPARSVEQIAAILSQGKTASNFLVVPEGSTLAKIETLAAAQGISDTDFKSALADSYTSQYASDRPKGVDLEGYLFPDGYQVIKATTAHSLIQEMLTDFDRKFSPELVSAFAAEGLSPHQGLTLASIIEREVANSSDRPIVAQVFLKRIRDGQALQSDVTVHYAADQLGVAFSTTLDSPYNTYRNKGLPPGPICSPGLDALNAAAHPATTNYSYFLAGKDGKTYFANTFAEHQANIAKYLN
jgi:UPF0755 protein